MRIELLFRHVNAALRQSPGCGDAFDRKTAQRISLVAMRIQIPVIPVMNETLRGDYARTGLIVPARMIVDTQTVSLQQGTRHRLKTDRLNIASGHAQDMHSPCNLIAIQMPACQNFFDAILDGFELRVEQSGLDLRQQLLRGQQRVDFSRTEPESGQFESLTFVRLIEVAVAQPVVLDRRIEIQTHFRNNAPDRGARTFEFFLQDTAGYRMTARGNRLMQLVD